MRIGRVMQDAGRERPLVRGETYDLPDVVGMALIATGAGESIGDDASSRAITSEEPPENNLRRPRRGRQR